MLRVVGGAELPPVVEGATQPFVGVTTDGIPIAGLSELRDAGAPTASAAEAATSFLNCLSVSLRGSGQLPLDAAEWRMWINAFLTFPEYGLLLQELSHDEREAALNVIRTSISSIGFERVREVMRLNGVLGELTGGYSDTLTEFCYRFTVFGDPSPEEPWGWQLQGHHLALNCVFVAGQAVLTPMFLGVELGGEELFAEHQRRARELMNSLTSNQRDRALLHGSMLTAELPPQLAGIVDGRHRAGAGRDNLVLPYEGLAGASLTPGQRELLAALTDPYLDTLPEEPRAHRRRQVLRHLDATRLAWIGPWAEGTPFYYRVHSPVLLVEYDNHAGIFLDNDEPEPFHVHTIVRTPNGGDYGKDLLRRHYAHEHATE
ncbi:DUF3500 domain-containing protein [Streptomyces sp. NPDC048002]|uniref:DUF3500 domain-containing protein n=1 Tax=Streptomyces sp. NPDC048002 TaxID=3154344 RepID=UPI0033F9C213